MSHPCLLLSRLLSADCAQALWGGSDDPLPSPNWLCSVPQPSDTYLHSNSQSRVGLQFFPPQKPPLPPLLVFPYYAHSSNIPHVFRAPSVSSVSSPPVPSLLLPCFPYVTLTLRPWAQHLCFPGPVHLQSPLLGEPFPPMAPGFILPFDTEPQSYPS